MKKIGTALLVLVVLGIALGFYRGWFVLTKPAAEVGSDKVNINLATDSGLIERDVQTAKDKATELTGGVTEDGKVDGQADDNVKSNDL
ncbi:hypothetical protein [Bythopirellula polymerisocia]|uniref:Uncharacterized protein n=1 Tax=Bythopirellula polymerisocia TaxID=2528003 RepID=A0A5C6D0T4_9BACT|nr:hypothetical protein [Bythopirellula polymerisocia]TWU30480.1 hypothetical protein Pla144_12670 [Bythopirellula polymerisocia]